MTIPATVTEIIVAMVANSRLVRSRKPTMLPGYCRPVARAVADVEVDSKIIAIFAWQQPEKPINGAFQGVFQQRKDMSGRRIVRGSCCPQARQA